MWCRLYTHISIYGTFLVVCYVNIIILFKTTSLSGTPGSGVLVRRPCPEAESVVLVRRPSPAADSVVHVRRPSPASLSGGRVRRPCPEAESGVLVRRPSPSSLSGDRVRRPCPAAECGGLVRRPSPASLSGGRVRRPCPEAESGFHTVTVEGRLHGDNHSQTHRDDIALTVFTESTHAPTSLMYITLIEVDGKYHHVYTG